MSNTTNHEGATTMNITTCPGSNNLGLGLTRSETHDECICCGKMLRVTRGTYTIVTHTTTPTN